MRIAYITVDPGVPVFGEKGASIHVQSMTNAFAALGHEVSVLATRVGVRTEPLHAQISKVRDPEVEQPVGDVETDGHSKLPPRERRTLRLGLAAEAAVVRQHRDSPFDFLYERQSLFSAAAVRAARALGIPCVIELNAPLLREQQAYRQLVCAEEAAAIEREVFAGADALVAVSDEVRRYAVSRGAAPERTFVMPNGVDTAHFSPTAQPLSLDLPPDSFVVGFVGSLKAWHDVETLLEAFRILVAERDGCHLLIVGDGPLRGWIEGYTRGARLDGRVSVTGWHSYARMPRLLTAVDVAVAPYPRMEEFYFSPLKLYEYLACGRAIVASAIGQVGEVIDDGTTGLLVEPGSSRDLAARLAILHDDPELRARLGRAAAAAARNHSWESNAQRILGRVATLSGAGTGGGR